MPVLGYHFAFFEKSSEMTSLTSPLKVQETANRSKLFVSRANAVDLFDLLLKFSLRAVSNIYSKYSKYPLRA